MNKKLVENLIFGKYNSATVLEAVNDIEWQTFRISLKGKTTEEKVKRVEEYLKLKEYSLKAKIQVTNYIYALKRGGQIK